MIKKLIHIDYTTENSDGSHDIHRGDTFDKAEYDAIQKTLVVWKNWRSYVINNVVSLSMCGEAFNE